MKKIILILGLIVLSCHMALAAVTSFTMTFDSLTAVTSSGAQAALLDSQTTIDLLNLGSSGQTLTSINTLPAGDYVGLVANISAMTTTLNGTQKDILSAMAYNTGMNFSNVQLPTKPFTVAPGGGTNVTLNIYMNPSAFDGNGFPTQPPIFSVYSPVAPSSSVAGATINGVFSNVQGTSTGLYYGIFDDFESMPSFGGPATNNGDGTGSFSVVVPAGSYYIGGFEDSNGNASSTNGPDDGDNIFFLSGNSTPTQVTVISGETRAVTLTSLFSYTSNDETKRAGGGSAKISGEASITLTIQASQAVSLSETTDLYVGLFTNSPASQQGNSPGRVMVIPIAAGTFTSTSAVISQLAYDTYYLGAALDIGNDMSMGTGPTTGDYATMYGGFQSPQSIQLTTSKKNVDITNNPLTLMLYDESTMGGPPQQ